MTETIKVLPQTQIPIFKQKSEK